jgi:ketosteroid isomerase-like protein
LEFSEFAPREVIEHGETVLVLGTLAGQAKKTGKAVKNEWAHVFYISARKGRFFQEYIDTAADVLAQRKPVAPLNKKVSGQSWVLLAQG